MSVEEAGGRLGYHDHPLGGTGRGGFDNSLDISQIEREAAEGQEVNLTLKIFAVWKPAICFPIFQRTD